MFWFVTRVWRSNVKCIPGATDISALYDEYIAESQHAAFNNALIDLSAAVQKSLAVNEQKWAAVRRMLQMFEWQIGVLALAIGWHGAASILRWLLSAS